MNDHQGAIAALLIALGLVAWYAACERRDRIRAEAERDDFEGELAARVADVRAEVTAKIEALAADCSALATEHYATGNPSRAGAHAGVANRLRALVADLGGTS